MPRSRFKPILWQTVWPKSSNCDLLRWGFSLQLSILHQKMCGHDTDLVNISFYRVIILSNKYFLQPVYCTSIAHCPLPTCTTELWKEVSAFSDKMRCRTCWNPTHVCRHFIHRFTSPYNWWRIHRTLLFSRPAIPNPSTAINCSITIYFKSNVETYINAHILQKNAHHIRFVTCCLIWTRT